MNEGIHLDLDTWIVPGQILKANLCRGLGNSYKPAGTEVFSLVYYSIILLLLVEKCSIGDSMQRQGGTLHMIKSMNLCFVITYMIYDITIQDKLFCLYVLDRQRLGICYCR